jgi:hypothetical protein
MTTPPSPPAPDPDDAVVENEWRRIEDARIAEELAEAREEVESPPHPRAGSWLPAWQIIAFALALAAGIAAAVLIDRPPKPVDPTWPPKTVKPLPPPQETP